MNFTARAFIFCGMLGLAMGCRPSAEKKSPAAAAQVPTQIMRTFEVTDLQDGAKSNVLRAREARLFEALHRAELDAPDITFFKQGKESSRLTAPRGTVDMNTRDMEAWGGVKIVTAEGDVLTTEKLSYDAKRRKIRTDQPVRLVRSDSITEGVGMESDPELERVDIGKQKVRFLK